jgi:hypothetical protein
VIDRPESGRGRFPLNDFTCCLTLFPESYSSFARATCSLSVSGRYLALEGVYLPLEQHSQATRLFEWASLGSGRALVRGSHPPRRRVPAVLGRPPLARGPICRLQLGPRGGPDFKSELLPLRSPLLGQSLLVSFPPLTDMLKFSGYPCPIRGHTLRLAGVRWRAPRAFPGELRLRVLRAGTRGRCRRCI